MKILNNCTMNKIVRKFFWIFALLLSTGECQICNEYCDGRDPSEVAEGARVADSATISGRLITLTISDEANMAYATISNGSSGDEIWIDRSFNATLTWEPLLGFTTISPGEQETNTAAYNIDNNSVRGLGAVRACGRGLGGSGPLICTQWARSTVLAGNPIDAAATALMQYYDGALWHTVGWWNGANAFTALLKHMQLTGSTDHFHVIESTFTNNLGEWDGNFTSDSLDDTEWWALAWIDAYDITGNRTYLDMAIFDADYIYEYVDDVCGGGVWWSTHKTYKNAITNELYILIAASLHNRLPGDTKFLHQAIDLWNWFRQSGMINEEHLINDGLRDDCQSNRDTTWTYNQGVILGALTELYKATNDSNYLTQANTIANAVMNSPDLTRNGVLTEPCEYSGQVGCGNHTGGCDCNQISFKGIFMRHLGDLNRNVEDRPYQDYILRQGQVNYASNRNMLNQYGIHYAGPMRDVNAGTQQSSMESYLAAI